MRKITYCDTALTSVRKVAIIPRFVNITTENNCTRNPPTEVETACVMLIAVY